MGILQGRLAQLGLHAWHCDQIRPEQPQGPAEQKESCGVREGVGDQYKKTFFADKELPSSAHWHHFLDTHIGLTGTQGDNGNYCDEAFGALTKGLQSANVGFSTRDESDEMHLYVGYEGTTAWEYNLAT